MPLLLQPNKDLIHLEHLYTEKQTKHGKSIFTFIDSPEQLKTMIDNGCIMEEDVRQAMAEHQARREEFQLDPSKVIRKIRTDWAPLNWRESNNIYSSCMKQTTLADGNPSIELDAIKFRDQKLKTCLKNWDIKDDNGQNVPLNAATIDTLASEVAQKLIDDFDRVTQVPEEELKN